MRFSLLFLQRIQVIHSRESRIVQESHQPGVMGRVSVGFETSFVIRALPNITDECAKATEIATESVVVAEASQDGDGENRSQIQQG